MIHYCSQIASFATDIVRLNAAVVLNGRSKYETVIRTTATRLHIQREVELEVLLCRQNMRFRVLNSSGRTICREEK